MVTIRFTVRAEEDLYGIGVYTIHKWGAAQAERYVGLMEECFQALAKNPGLGRPCDNIRPEMRRMEQGRHVVFYREEAGGILIARILHQSMLPENMAMDDDEDMPSLM